MLDIDTGDEIEALYKMVRIKGSNREEKFQTTDIKRALRFLKWYAARYKEGLLLEIHPKKKSYDWKNKKVDYSFD